MNIKTRLTVLIITAGLLLSACNDNTMIKEEDTAVETLEIYSDGSMVFKDRLMPVKDVIIYPDGNGGEKAAVKIYFPMALHPPFYRDSIVVERKESVYTPETRID